MARPSTWFRRAAVLGCLLVAGCAAQTREKWVRVFFTGIDPPRPAPVAPTAATNATVRPSALPPAAPVFVHKPFGERQCAACHLMDQGQQLRATGAALCRTCHERLPGDMKFVHAPVANGECGECHLAHESVEPKLLRRPGDATCVECHERALLDTVSAHAAAGSAACVGCHDPHGSNLKGLLKPQS
jgi:predicted CXXCH cytochrome family protein